MIDEWVSGLPSRSYYKSASSKMTPEIQRRIGDERNRPNTNQNQFLVIHLYSASRLCPREK